MALVLIIDDSVGQIAQIKSILQDLGHEVISALDWQECRKHLGAGPEIILVDVHLPGYVSGDVLAMNIRKNPPTSKAKILFHSASDEGDLQKMVIRASADGYIKKTKNEAEFIENFKRLTDT